MVPRPTKTVGILITFGASFLGCFGRFSLSRQPFRALKLILSHGESPKNGDSRTYELAPKVNSAEAGFSRSWVSTGLAVGGFAGEQDEAFGMGLGEPVV